MTGSVRRLACLIALLFAGLYFHSSAADGALRQEGQCTPTGSLVALPALPEVSGLASSLRVPGVTADPLDPHSVVAELPRQRSNARLVTVQAALPIDVDLTLAARAAEASWSTAPPTHRP